MTESTRKKRGKYGRELSNCIEAAMQTVNTIMIARYWLLKYPNDPKIDQQLLRYRDLERLRGGVPHMMVDAETQTTDGKTRGKNADDDDDDDLDSDEDMMARIQASDTVTYGLEDALLMRSSLAPSNIGGRIFDAEQEHEATENFKLVQDKNEKMEA